RTADVVVNYLTRLFAMPVLEITTTGKFFRQLEDIDPDIVVTTADAYGKVLGSYSPREGLPFFIVVTDIAVFVDTANPHARHVCYFEETAEAIRSFDFDLTYFSFDLLPDTGILRRLRYLALYLYDFVIRSGSNRLHRGIRDLPPRVNNARCHVVGPFTESKYFARHDQRAARRTLGLPEEGDLVLMTGGSGGGRFLQDTLDQSERGFAGPATVVVACGTAQRTLREIQRRSARQAPDHPVQIVPFGFTDQF